MKIARVIVPTLIGWAGAVAYWIGSAPEETPGSSADVVIVLGAEVHGDTPLPDLRERIAHAIDLHDKGRASNLVFTGGQAEDDTVAESEAAREMALEGGVEPSAVLIETESSGMMQNLVEAQLVMRDAGLNSALIVTDPLQMRRAMEMADSIGIEAQPSAAPTTRERTSSAKALYLLRETWFMHRFWIFGE